MELIDVTPVALAGAILGQQFRARV
jgi:hypothetical protein